LQSISLGYGQYYRGFSALGHDVRVFTLDGSGEGFGYPVAPFRAEEAVDPAYWRSKRLEAAFITTGLGMTHLLSAMRAAGVRVINFTDTDGLIGYSVHPLATLKRMIVYYTSWPMKMRCLKFWLQKVIFQASAFDAETLSSLTLSEIAVLSNPETQRLVRDYLFRQGRRDLLDLTAVIPAPVHEQFCDAEVPSTKRNVFVAVGRWDDPAKHGELLAAALDQYYRSGGSAEAAVIGPGGEALFDPLTAQFRRVRYLGHQPREVLLGLLRDAWGIVFSSRWEGGPNAANEMLAMGGTVVGPPIPALVGLVDGTRFGRVARSHRSRALADAIAAEEAAWDEGRRDPRCIARHWRAVLHPLAVCSRIMEGLAQAPSERRSPVGVR